MELTKTGTTSLKIRQGKRKSAIKEEGKTKIKIKKIKIGTNCPDHTISTVEGSDIQGEWKPESVDSIESRFQDAGFGRSPRTGSMYLDRKRSIRGLELPRKLQPTRTLLRLEGIVNQ